MGGLFGQVDGNLGRDLDGVMYQAVLSHFYNGFLSVLGFDLGKLNIYLDATYAGWIGSLFWLSNHAPD